MDLVQVRKEWLYDGVRWGLILTVVTRVQLGDAGIICTPNPHCIHHHKKSMCRVYMTAILLL